MANSVPFYRLYLNEKLRKVIGINLKRKRIYLFKVKTKTYLSTDTIPKSGKVTILRVKLGLYSWYIDIPANLVEYIPTGFRLLNTHGKVLELTSE